MTEGGRFVLSFDTELCWGTFDSLGVSANVDAFANTRDVVADLCELLDRYEVPATWALVGHLLEDCNGHHDLPTPRFDWIDDWYGSLPCATGVDREYWYAPDLLDTIRDCDTDQELALHGYTHASLGVGECPPAVARTELERALAVAAEHDFDPVSFVFPRNEIGHLDVLRETGVTHYRDVDARWFERSLPEWLRKPFRYADEATRWQPPTVVPFERAGVTAIPGTQQLRPFHGWWRYTPANSQIVRAKKGLERAATHGETFHLWTHPFNLARTPGRHLELFDDILEYAARLRAEGRLTFQPMSAIDAGSPSARQPIQAGSGRR